MTAQYPGLRLRRARHRLWSRELVAENQLTPSDFIWPVFVHGGVEDIAVSSMPGVVRYCRDNLVEAVKTARDVGIRAIALFPVIDDAHKDEFGSHAADGDNLVCEVVRALKKEVPEVGVICDVALDPFTSHGQDGILENGRILNDETIEALTAQAVNQAAAGCDVIAPSDMMDGRVGAIRWALDEAGHKDVIILSYAAKYASAFYGPFRDAVGSKAALGSADKRTYQMDPRNSDEALREVALDLEEGADWVMVKPALPYLDIVRRVKDTFKVPTFAYHVSGEYAMIKAAAEKGWLDGDKTMRESLDAIKRAGADGILTYAAVDIATKLH